MKIVSEIIRRIRRGRSGQALIESALILPFLFLLLFNAINFAYYVYVAINLTSATRDAVEYSIQGFQTASTTNLPSAGAVSTLAYDNLGSIPSALSTPMQVCTSANGVSSTTHKSLCTLYPSGSTVTWTTDADPEPTTFALNRVDVQYVVQPLIPGTVFGITLVPSFTFHRQVSMRAID